jgi:hypothetical protein
MIVRRAIRALRLVAHGATMVAQSRDCLNSEKPLPAPNGR